MITCRRAAELISRDVDDGLSWGQRLALGFHLVPCSLCRHFKRHVRLLDQASRRWASPGRAGGDLPRPVLSREARQRIKRALRNGPG